MKYDKIIITGGAGFIGANVIKELNEVGFNDVFCIDYLGSDEKWRNLVEMDYYDYVDADYFRKSVVNGGLSIIKSNETCAVIHLGACSSTTEKNADYVMDNNYTYSKEIAGWSLKNGYRFVYASSAATYGDGSNGYSDQCELSSLKPLNIYGYSKHYFDLHSKQKGWLDKIAGLKYFNVYGPYEDHKNDMRSVVNKAFDQISLNGTVKLFQSHRDDYENGMQRRDFVYVKDIVKETLFLAENTNVNGLFNAGSGVAGSFLDLANNVFLSLDMKPNIEFIPMPENLRNKYQYYTKADMEKIRDAGFDSKPHTLSEGVKDYVNYLQSKNL